MEGEKKKLSECRTIYELAGNISETWVERYRMVLLLACIWLPITWLPAIYIKNMSIVLDMHYYSDLLRNIGLMMGAFYLIYLFFRLKGERLVKLKQILIKRPWNVVLLLILVWILISCLQSEDLSIAFGGSDYRREGFFQYLFYGVVYLFASQIKNERNKMLIYINFATVAFIGGIVLMLQYINLYRNGVDDLATGNHSCIGWFQNANHYGYYVTMAILCVALLCLVMKSRLRYLFFVEFVFLIWTLVQNDTMGGVVGITMAFVFAIVFSFFSGVIPTKKIAMLFLAFILTIVVISVLPEKLGGSDKLLNSIRLLGNDVEAFGVQDEEGIEDAGSGRIGIWQDALKIALEKPVFGQGPDQRVMYTRVDIINTRCACEYLYLFAAFGLPCGIMYLGALISGFLHQWKCRKKLTLNAAMAAIVVFGYLVSAVFGNSIYFIYPCFLIFLAFALSLSSYNADET